MMRARGGRCMWCEQFRLPYLSYRSSWTPLRNDGYYQALLARIWVWALEMVKLSVY